MSTTQIEEYDNSLVLEFINRNRKILNGKLVSEIYFKDIKKELERPDYFREKDLINISILNKDIENLNRLLKKEYKGQILEIEKEFKSLIKEIITNPEIIKDLKKFGLIELGLGLIDKSGNCPLCETKWAKGELKEYLNKKLSAIEKIKKYEKDLNIQSNKLISQITTTIDSIENICAIAESLNLKAVLEILNKWLKDLEILLEELNLPLEKSSRRLLIIWVADLSHHRTCRSAYGGSIELMH